ncbi:MAG: SHD1 domain-containing protein [Verrucomicrobiota bacterium]
MLKLTQGMGCAALLRLGWLALALAGPLAAEGEPDAPLRTWTSASGTKIEAKLVTKDATRVTLEKGDGTRVTVPLAQLSKPDVEFLAGSTAGETGNPGGAGATGTGATTIAGIDAKPGVASGEIFCVSEAKFSYYIYLPKAFHSGRTWPIMFIMDSGGGSPGSLERYTPGAEQLGMILAVSRQSQNDKDISQAAVRAMVKDVYARLPVIKSLSFATGFSGGSREAYALAEGEKHICGVLACASGPGIWLPGGQFRQAKLSHELIVCSLSGSNCFNRRETIAGHTRFNKATSRLIWFPAAHDWAAAPLITEGMAHVYGYALLKNTERSVGALRNAYAEAQLAWTKAQVEASPWNAWHWAEFLKKFPATGPVPQQATALAERLAQDEKVKLAIIADKAIAVFVAKFLGDGNTRADHTADAKRVADAAKKAEGFPSLPHAELLKKLAEPSPGG